MSKHFRYIKPGYFKWTEADDAVMREIYHTPITMAEIVAKVGHPKESVYKRAIQLGLKRPPIQRTGGGMAENTIKALELGARPGGVRAAEMGMEGDKASSLLVKLVKRGKLHRGILGRKTVRYFTTQKAADAYVAANLAAHLAEAARHQPKKYLGGARWDRDAPMVITPQTKFTYAPPPPAQVFRTNTHAR